MYGGENISEEEALVIGASAEVTPQNGEFSASLDQKRSGAALLSEVTAQQIEPEMRIDTLHAQIDGAFAVERAKKLEAQFNETHLLELDEETLEYAMIEPDKESREESAREWTVFIGGFSSIKETYKSEMLDLAESGKNVIFVSPDKGIDPSDDESQYFQTKEKSLPSTIQHKAAAVAKLLEHLGIDTANIIGHSQGGAVAAALSGAHPEMTKRLILDNPAGLIGKDSTRELLHRVHDEAGKEFRNHKRKEGEEQDQKTWLKQLQKIMHFAGWRAAEEIPALANIDIRPILEELKKQKEAAEGKGAEIILINANDDRIFRQEDVARALGDNALEQYIDRWVMYTEKDAGHGKMDRGDGKLLTQVMDEPKRTSVIHQLLTEEDMMETNR